MTQFDLNRLQKQRDRLVEEKSEAAKAIIIRLQAIQLRREIQQLGEEPVA